VNIEVLWILIAACFVIAALYSTVGHAGASGYLATMALLGVAPATMRPTALALNIVVAAIAVWRFARAGYFNGRGLWPFLAGSVPFAALGGAWHVGTQAYRSLVGVALLASAAILAWRAWEISRPTAPREDAPVRVPILAAVLIGAGIGLLSGLTGTGGGIFLSPFLLLARWAGPRHTAGISAPFILANSLAGLIAGTATWASLPRELPAFVLAVVVGGFVGTWLGVTRLPPPALLVALAAVLIIAGGKLLT
jgi:hypothetical protein